MYTAVFPLHTKGEAFDVLLTYVKKIEKQAGRDIFAVTRTVGSSSV